MVASYQFSIPFTAAVVTAVATSLASSSMPLIPPLGLSHVLRCTAAYPPERSSPSPD